MAYFSATGTSGGSGGVKLKDINPNKSATLDKGWSMRLIGGGTYGVPVQGYKNIYIASWYNTTFNYRFYDGDGNIIGTTVSISLTSRVFSNAITIPDNATAFALYFNDSYAGYLLWSLEA